MDQTDNSFEIIQMLICFPQNWSLACVYDRNSCTCARPLQRDQPVIQQKQPSTQAACLAPDALAAVAAPG